MSVCFNEPTIDELLGDSLTQGLMKADGVDATALERMLRGLAAARNTAATRAPARINLAPIHQGTFA